MNNTRTEIYQNLDNAIHISYIALQTCGFLCTFFGLPGHLFQILIFTNKTNRKEPKPLYFTAIAIFEFIFLLDIFWLWCVSMSIIKTDPRHILPCGIFYIMLVGPTILSNLYLASMSLDQSLMILYPAHYRRVITPCHTMIRLFLILIIVIIIMTPHPFYYYYDTKTTIFVCEFHKFVNPWIIRIWPFVHGILFVLIPSIITCISSIILFQNRYNHRKTHQNRLSEVARRIERNSVLIVFISIIISFCILPLVTLEILIVHDLLSNRGIISSIKVKKYKILLNWFLTLVAVNYSAKFYLHLIVSKTFRRDFIQLFNCNFRQKEKIIEENLIPLNIQNRTQI